MGWIAMEIDNTPTPVQELGIGDCYVVPCGNYENTALTLSRQSVYMIVRNPGDNMAFSVAVSAFSRDSRVPQVTDYDINSVTNNIFCGSEPTRVTRYRVTKIAWR